MGRTSNRLNADESLGGECEIRTHGRFHVGSFQDCWFKPLTQLSGTVDFMLTPPLQSSGRKSVCRSLKKSSPRSVGHTRCRSRAMRPLRSASSSPF
jgi:hypothetical protein